jgi:hypothetical protein
VDLRNEDIEFGTLLGLWSVLLVPEFARGQSSRLRL